jgi:hypothetical protein
MLRHETVSFRERAVYGQRNILSCVQFKVASLAVDAGFHQRLGFGRKANRNSDGIHGLVERIRLRKRDLWEA